MGRVLGPEALPAPRQQTTRVHCAEAQSAAGIRCTPAPVASGLVPQTCVVGHPVAHACSGRRGRAVHGRGNPGRPAAGGDRRRHRRRRAHRDGAPVASITRAHSPGRSRG